jgi:hypothetical protein
MTDVLRQQDQNFGTDHGQRDARRAKGRRPGAS